MSVDLGRETEMSKHDPASPREENSLGQNREEADDHLWTAEQTAEYLSCSVQHALRLAILGVIPAIDLAPPKSRNRMWRFKSDSIRTWVREREKARRP